MGIMNLIDSLIDNLIYLKKNFKSYLYSLICYIND